jgi:hypothetical protein
MRAKLADVSGPLGPRVPLGAGEDQVAGTAADLVPVGVVGVDGVVVQGDGAPAGSGS